jgi:hypothetical protein
VVSASSLFGVFGCVTYFKEGRRIVRASLQIMDFQISR